VFNKFIKTIEGYSFNYNYNECKTFVIDNNCKFTQNNLEFRGKSISRIYNFPGCIEKWQLNFLKIL